MSCQSSRLQQLPGDKQFEKFVEIASLLALPELGGRKEYAVRGPFAAEETSCFTVAWSANATTQPGAALQRCVPSLLGVIRDIGGGAD